MLWLLFAFSRPLGHLVLLPGLHLPLSSFSALCPSPVHLSSVHLGSWNFEHRSSDSGGAVSFLDAYLEISDCLFQSNRANSRGGALFLNNQVSALAISNSFFLHNSAKEGGALYCQCLHGWATVSSSLFDNNTASSSGQHVYVSGCGSLSLSSCSLRNSPGYQAMTILNAPNIAVDGCSFFRNSGAIVVELRKTDRLEFNGCCFAEGLTYVKIGGNGVAVLTDCCFNGTNASVSVPPTFSLATVGCTFGVCDKCRFAPTPPPSQTLHATMGSPAIIAMIAVISGIAAIAIVGVAILRWRCKSGQRTGTEEKSGSRNILTRALTGTGEGELAARV
jgi:predicted outer membrane repeat protein